MKRKVKVYEATERTSPLYLRLVEKDDYVLLEMVNELGDRLVQASLLTVQADEYGKLFVEVCESVNTNLCVTGPGDKIKVM